MRSTMRPCLLVTLLLAGIALALAVLSLADVGPTPVVSASASPSLLAQPESATRTLTPTVFLPLVAHQWAAPLKVNPQDRQASADFFNNVYRASNDVDAGWTGNHADCDPGATSQAFRDAVQLRINYFRAMAGVPAGVRLSDEYNRKAQQAALMMSVNEQLSHNPPSSWQCYTQEGAEAAGSSNLYLGRYGPPAISGYVMDPGSGNYLVGHRRWILYPQTRQMGSGDVPSVSGYRSANALWVFDENLWTPRPQTREEYVAWPPPGYVPYQVVFPRWSFSYAQADFSSASVEMSTGGQNVPLAVQPVAYGYGENTLVWEPAVSFDSAPEADVSYSVVVRHVAIGGALRDFAYQVIVFDPGPDRSVIPAAGDGFLGTPPESH